MGGISLSYPLEKMMLCISFLFIELRDEAEYKVEIYFTLLSFLFHSLEEFFKLNKNQV